MYSMMAVAVIHRHLKVQLQCSFYFATNIQLPSSSSSLSSSSTSYQYMLSSSLSSSSEKPHIPIKIVIGGRGQSFSGAVDFTREALAKRPGLKHAIVVKADNDSLDREIVDATVVIPFMLTINKRALQMAPKLKLIMQYGVGLEGVDIVEAKSRGVLVGKIASSESANALSCAEHSIFLALACFRQLNQLQSSLRSQLIGFPTGRTLAGNTAAIYGFGGIARELSPLLKAMRMKVVVISNSASRLSDIEKQELKSSYKFDELHSPADWNSFGSSIDVLFLCCTLNASSHNLVNQGFLKASKQGMVIINVSRGGLLDYPAVLKALESGQLGALGIDVYHTEPFPLPSEDPLLRHPRVIATPHVAGVTETSHGQMADIIADNVERLVDGLPLKGLV